MTLADTGRISLNDLTRRVARDKSQMTRTIRGLETKGLVLREPSAEDGRVTMVLLTPEGNQVVGELMQAVSQVIGDVLDPLTPDEISTLKGLLARALP